MGAFEEQQKKAQKALDTAKAQNDAAKGVKAAVKKTLESFRIGKKRDS